MRLKLYLINVLLFVRACNGCSAFPLYIYPIDCFERLGNPHMLVLKQWSSDRLELYDCNSVTGSMDKVLMACYTPAAATLLPDLSGFSFVDNGRIRIKRFEKRAVKTLDIYEPVYGIELIRWLDDQTCYFHAQSDARYGIYTLTLEEELNLLIASSHADYLYPYIVDQEIFYIKRVVCGNKFVYTIERQAMSNKAAQPQIIADFNTSQIVMLQMLSTHEGYVLECAMQTDTDNVIFHYHQIDNNKGSWDIRELFRFEAPKNLFYGPTRLYESLIPFVPRIMGSKFYFSSCTSENSSLALHSFDRATSKIECIAKAECHLFAPVFCEHKLWCGGTSGSLHSFVDHG